MGLRPGTIRPIVTTVRNPLVSPPPQNSLLDGIVTGQSRLPRMLGEILLTWQRRADERDRLATLDPRLLSDMGISEAAATREAAIPFWRAN